MHRTCPAERWLKCNRRIALVGVVPPCVSLVLGLTLSTGWLGLGGEYVQRAAGVVLLMLSVVAMAVWLYVTCRPRLVYHRGHLLVFLTGHRPARVPIELVECFFMGQGPSHLPGRGGGDVQTVNVVVRLAEKSRQWKNVDVLPVLGQWRDGYITIRGAWCEPLSQELLNRLNQRLASVKRERMREQPTEGTGP